MVDFSRMTDPGENVQFRRDWGAGRFQVKLAAEAARWLESRRKKRRQASEFERCRRAGEVPHVPDLYPLNDAANSPGEAPVLRPRGR